MSILGHVDELREGMVCGWAYDDRMSGEPVDIILRSGGADLGSIKADVYRDDLAKAGIGKGYHAFYFRLSPRHLRPGASIEVYAGSELWPIPGGQLKVAGTDAVGPAESFPEERSTPQREMQRLFAEGLAEWGKAAFESLPRFIANAAGSGGGRQIGTNEFGTLDAIVKRVTNDFSAIELPFLEAPVASIIIPTFNQFELTYNCIKSLHATGTSALAEIIVADDASTDAIVMLSSLVKNLRVSRNATNLGFLRKCNAAAKMARGEFLIFLNNDRIEFLMILFLFQKFIIFLLIL